MTAVQKLTKHLAALPDGERIATLLLEIVKEKEWDRQIEADVLEGKLNSLINKAKSDHLAGRTTAL